MQKITRKQCIDTAMLLALAAITLFLFDKGFYFIWSTIVILIMALIVPVIFYPFAWLWFGLSKVLGLVTSHVLLTLIYYVVVVPVGLLRRWMGKDNLHLKKFKQGGLSVWKTRNHLYIPEDLENTF